MEHGSVDISLQRLGQTACLTGSSHYQPAQKQVMQAVLQGIGTALWHCLYLHIDALMINRFKLALDFGHYTSHIRVCFTVARK